MMIITHADAASDIAREIRAIDAKLHNDAVEAIPSRRLPKSVIRGYYAERLGMLRALVLVLQERECAEVGHSPAKSFEDAEAYVAATRK